MILETREVIEMSKVLYGLVALMLVLAAIPAVGAVGTTITGGNSLTGTATGAITSAGGALHVVDGSVNCNYAIADSTKRVEVLFVVPFAHDIKYSMLLTPSRPSTMDTATLTGKQTFSITGALDNYNDVQASVSATNTKTRLSASTNLYSYNYNYNTPLSLANVVQTASVSANIATASETIGAAYGGYDFWTHTYASNNAKGWQAETYFGTWYNGGQAVNMKGLSMSSQAIASSVSSSAKVGQFIVPASNNAESYMEGYAYTPTNGRDAWIQYYNVPKTIAISNAYATASVDRFGQSRANAGVGSLLGI
jgi:hypothetical protein